MRIELNDNARTVLIVVVIAIVIIIGMMTDAVKNL